jgi:hypothetical protein
MGYHEGLAHIQLWLVSHLVSQIEFDIWDVILSEMEDTIAEGFKGLAPICSLDLLPPLQGDCWDDPRDSGRAKWHSCTVS